jgi:hypothetical protein
MRYIRLIDLKRTLQTPVSKEAPTARPKETPARVEEEKSNDVIKKEAGEIKDIVQTINPNRAEDRLPIINEII